MASLLVATGIPDLPMDVCAPCFLADLVNWSWSGTQLNTIWRRASIKSPCDRHRRDCFFSSWSDRLAGQTAKDQPPTSPLMTSPNRSHFSPLNLSNCSCEIGAKSEGLVLTLMPGSRPPSSRSLMLAACFITFSRVRLSPHAFSTWTKPCATVSCGLHHAADRRADVVEKVERLPLDFSHFLDRLRGEFRSGDVEEHIGAGRF